MPHVPPVGGQQSRRPRARRFARVACDVRARFLDLVEHHAIPSRGGACVRAQPRVNKPRDLAEIRVSLVAPVEDRAIGRDIANGLGMVLHHVAPEHEGLSASRGLPPEKPDMVEIQGRGAPAPDPARVGALAEIVGFVAAHVEGTAGEGREEIVEHAPQQPARLRQAGVDRRAAQALDPPRVFPVARGPFDLRELAVSGQAEDAAHVPEAREAGHELDMPLAAMPVQCAQLCGSDGIRAARDRGIEAKGEDMFDVELELVDLQGSERVGQLQEGLQSRDAAPADIQVIAAARERRTVADGARGDAESELANQLAEGLDSIEQAGPAVADHFDAAGRDVQAVRLRRVVCAGFEGDASFARSAAVPQVGAQRLDSRQILFGSPDEHNRSVPPALEAAMSDLHARWLRQEMKGHGCRHSSFIISGGMR